MQILETFLKTEKHLTAEELHRLVQRKNPSIGKVTVYRTLKLLKESWLCRELRPQDGTMRYEHLYEHEHHDHIVCTDCGALVGVVDPRIEKIQEKLTKAHGFHIKSHKLEIYGLCRKCR
jgi:Fur family ferric uptake transcriptional regulator